MGKRFALGARHQRPRRASRVRRYGPSITWPTSASRTGRTTTPTPSASDCAAWPPRRCERRAARSSGTLAISTAQPRIFEADDLDLLQGLADQAAIALTNSNLLARLTREEARFRGLVQTTPDVIWHADRTASSRSWPTRPRPCSAGRSRTSSASSSAFLTHPDSMPFALERYAAVGGDPGPGRAGAAHPRPPRRLAPSPPR